HSRPGQPDTPSPGSGPTTLSSWLSPFCFLAADRANYFSGEAALHAAGAQHGAVLGIVAAGVHDVEDLLAHRHQLPVREGEVVEAIYARDVRAQEAATRGVRFVGVVVGPDHVQADVAHRVLVIADEQDVGRQV